MSNFNRQIDLRRKDPFGADYRELLDTPPNSIFRIDKQGKTIVLPVNGAFTSFELLSAASVAAASDKLGVHSGTGTEVIARSAAGGQNCKTQATTPADGDTVIYAAEANTGFVVPITAASRPVFITQVRIGATAFATMFASFGLNENITDADPTGTAGEGAMFLYDPTQEVTTGLTAAQHLNWILAHKVDGADTFTATTIPVVAATDYELKIVLGVDLKASFYIDGEYVGIGPALTSGDSVKVFMGAELTATPDGQADFDMRFIGLHRHIG